MIPEDADVSAVLLADEVWHPVHNRSYTVGEAITSRDGITESERRFSFQEVGERPTRGVYTVSGPADSVLTVRTWEE